MIRTVMNKLSGNPDFINCLKANYVDETSNDLSIAKMFPTPEDLEIEAGTRATVGIELYLSKICPKMRRFGHKEDKISLTEYHKLLKLVQEKTGYPLTDMNLRKINRFKKVYKNRFDYAVELGEKQVRNIQKYGYANFLSWENEKYNYDFEPYHSEFGEDYVVFETFKRISDDVLKNISKLFPNEIIDYSYMNTSLQSNKHFITLRDGDITKIDEYNVTTKKNYDLEMEM